MAQKKIYFKDEFVEPVEEGVKTSIVTPYFDGKVGDLVEARSNLSTVKRCFGRLRIKGVTYIRFDDIDKNIARTEGYLHENLLKAELLRTYPDLEDSSLLYYVVFEWR